jgi:diguanylate cyclase (GGDEF)-like protein
MASLPAEKLLAIIDTQNEIAATAPELDAVMALVTRRAQELTGAAAGVIEMLERDEMVYAVTSGAAQPYRGTRLPADASLSGLCVARGEILHCEDAAADDRVDREACERVGAGSLLCVPLRHAGAVVGVLKVYDPRPRAFADDDVQTLSLLSGVIAAHMARSSHYAEERYASRHDVLTGLPNRRCFEERLAAEAARIRRHGGEVALCLIDLDRFKHVNHTLGQAAGDEALGAVARHLDGVRGEDGAYRIGGDEFALILVGADEAGAGLAAERIRAAVAADPGCHGVGVSIGIAFLGTDPAAALALADAKLYAAKALRR